MPYIETKELPACLLNALKAAGFNRAQINVEASSTWEAAGGGGDGIRAFKVLVNLTTGETQTHVGSWGGANMFNRSNPIDLDTTSRPLPEGFAVITGSSGGGKPVWCMIYVNPANMAPLLPAAQDELSPRLKWIVSVFARYNSMGRKREFENHPGPTETELADLAAKGYIKRTKVGVSITVSGRNIADSYPRYPGKE